MSGVGAFFEMGGYAGYVWPAYVGSASVLTALCIASWRRLRRLERSVAAATAVDARVSVATLANPASTTASVAPKDGTTAPHLEALDAG